ncbi:MAG: cytochrome b/b6 domain-containing protein [Gammaproteobacteria bacterium]
MSTYRVRVWDLPVRLFHWAIVGLVCFAWWSAEEGGVTLKYHMWCGYTVFGLVLFRIAWGFTGSRYARFGEFLHGPRRVLESARMVWTRAPSGAVGHNPLGGWMIVALLVSLLVQAGTGLFANDDLFNEGPLYGHVGKDLSDLLTGIHHVNFNVLCVLIALHVAAVAWHRLRKGERLVGAMFNGCKQLPAPAPEAAPTAPWRAALAALASAAVVVTIVNL